MSGAAAAPPAHLTGPTNRTLDSGWKFRSLAAPAALKEHPETGQWHTATVPGVVQTDLLDNRLIPDPFYQDNEKRLQWIGLTDWEYETTFSVSAPELARKHIELVFDGLDTFADVTLNGTAVLSANNMFRTWRVDAGPLLHPGSNTLHIAFHSPVETMLPIVRAMAVKLPTVGQIVPVSEEGIPTDPYVRKAPYNYGWDWGPRFVNEGIWKPIHLVTWDDVRLDAFHIQQPSVNANQANLVAEVNVQADRAMTATVTVTGSPLAGQPAALAATATRTIGLEPGANHVLLPFSIEKPQLWYPVGYGGQARYDFKLRVATPARTLAETGLRAGLRSVEMRRQVDDIGKSFEFVINGIPVFAKGSDVIPFDSFPNRVTPASHRQILQSARDANMNMVREWGGGYYESDDFYDIADELGIMVWQEFMFGGEMIPGDAAFRENVREEAIQQVDRLRDHPSIVFWCGNNEVESGWKTWGNYLEWERTLTPDQKAYVWQSYLLIFNDVLKNVVATHDAEIPYQPSSPTANYEDEPGNQTNGDMHYWDVWGNSAPVSDYNKITPRFMSEYGFQSFPEMRTIRAFATPADLDINSATMLSHQKNNGGNARISRYLKQEYPDPKDFASFVYLSQVEQAEAIKVGAEHLRRSRPRTMGSLFWQLNDCWPVASWASIDYYGRWKALQYYSRRFYSDLLVSPYFHDGGIDTYIISDKLTPVEATLRTQLLDMSGKQLSVSENTYQIPAASSTMVVHTDETALLGSAKPSDVFAHYELIVGGQVVSENTVYFDVYRKLKLPAAVIASNVEQDGPKLKVTLSSKTLARDVSLSFGDEDVALSDNYFDLMPGQSKTIELTTKASLEAIKQSLQVMSLTDAFAAK